MVGHLKVAVKLGVLVLDGVEAVRAHGDELLHALRLEELDVTLGLHLVQVLVAQAARRVTGAPLLVAQHPEADACLQQQPGRGLGHLDVALLEGAGAAHPEQILLAAVEHGDLDPLRRHLLDPGGAGELRPPPGVAPLLQLRQGGLGRLRHVRLFHHQVAAHVKDGGHVLDEHRALVHAGAAGHAVPYRLEAHPLDQRRRLLGSVGRGRQARHLLLQEVADV